MPATVGVPNNRLHSARPQGRRALPRRVAWRVPLPHIPRVLEPVGHIFMNVGPRKRLWCRKGGEWRALFARLPLLGYTCVVGWWRYKLVPRCSGGTDAVSITKVGVLCGRRKPKGPAVVAFVRHLRCGPQCDPDVLRPSTVVSQGFS